MNPKLSSSVAKKVYISFFLKHEQLAQALLILKNHTDVRLTPTIILKLYADRSDTAIDAKNFEKRTIAYWNEFWNVLPPSAVFDHELIGTFLAIGPLVSIFNTKIDGRPLAIMANGPHNILRGLGVDEVRTTAYVEHLAEGRHMLIVRLLKNEQKLLERALEMLKP